VAREALGTGATGYVSKLDAALELLSAVDAVLLGEQFVSTTLAGRGLTGNP
jgi:DNA-binding NarL/FixJ family response regulator